MKHIILTIVAVLSLRAATAQTAPTVYIDSANFRSYAAINPIQLPFFADSISVVRLYIQFRQPLVPAWIATMWYGLFYPRYIDSTTIQWQELFSDVIQIHTPGTLTGAQAVAGGMVYVRDSVYYRGNKWTFTFQ